MAGHRPQWGIREILILLLLLTLAPFLLLEAFRATQDVQRQGDEGARRTTVQAAESAQVTDDFLGYTERSLASYTAARTVRSLDSQTSLGFLESVRAQHPNYEGVFLLASDGSEVASTEPGFYSRLNAERPFVQEAAQAGRMLISDAIGLPEGNSLVLLLTYPVTGDEGAPIGVLGVALNLNRLSSVIGYARPSSGSIVLLVQGDSTIIASSSNSDAWVGRPLTDGRSGVRSGGGAGNGTSVQTFGDQIERVTATHSVQSTSWSIIAGIPQAEVDAARRDALVRIGEEVALAVAAAALLAWVMLRRVLVPIRMLSNGAREFADGHLDRRIPMRRADELGSLADVLNGMAGRLKQRLDEETAHAESLELLNRLQTEFVATASHELRTPVTAIRTYVEALMRPDISDDGLRRECLEGIDRTSARLANLARRLLDVSRIDSGQISLELAPVDAAELARAAIAQTAFGDGAGIELDIRPGDTVVEADAERVGEVLDNLIGNALKFSSPVAQVRLSVEPADGGTIIAVRDTGPGIAAAELPRIFERFYRIPGAAATRRIGGSGLGLYIARAYANAMGGRIWVESAIGKGSAFFVFLPAAKTEPQPLPEGDADGVAAASAAR